MLDLGFVRANLPLVEEKLRVRGRILVHWRISPRWTPSGELRLLKLKR